MTDKMPVSEVLAVLDECIAASSLMELRKIRAAVAELVSEVERLKDVATEAHRKLDAERLAWIAERDALRRRVEELEKRLGFAERYMDFKAEQT